jgi:hypothetical protein
MSAAECAVESGESAGCGAQAPLPRLPSLKKNNCIVNGRYRSVFVAQENIRLYIWKFGEQNVGALTVTAADTLKSSDFQKKWHSFLNSLRKVFPTGMWVRERQPRSGNWHAHAVVNVGWDVKVNFPFEQVSRGFYANVDSRLRAIWKRLREVSESHGFGRIEVLPLKYSGDACAKYFTKYLTKAFGSDKALGEERCRLFSVWGGVRFVRSRFVFVTSRIIQKKKRWLANILELQDETCLSKALGSRWWLHAGDGLDQVIMPPDFYQVGPANNRVWDTVGLRAWQTNWTGSVSEPSIDVIRRSQFDLFYEIGIECFGTSPRQATQFASELVEKANPRQLALITV